MPKLLDEQPWVASHGKPPPAAGATSTLNVRLVPTVIVVGVVTQLVIVAAANAVTGWISANSMHKAKSRLAPIAKVSDLAKARLP